MAMMSRILREVLNEIEPSKEELKAMGFELGKFLERTEKNIKKSKIDAEIFIGGSYAKGTLIRKGTYDIDLFLRFGKKHAEKDYSRLTKKILSGIKNVSVSHGSRDYFRIKVTPNLFFELVPVKRIKNPKEADNVTDLSYSHVRYIKKNVKGKKVLEGIKLAKSFCHATKTYGAESYIKGFSGYSLELLVYNFGSFEKFLKSLSKKQDKKLIIDMEKLYKKGDVLLDMNGAKLDSPVILVDPTYKERNALAGLSEETFAKFQKSAAAFLKNPSKRFFEHRDIDFEKIKASNEKALVLEISTEKEDGDVAGTKLLKFFNHLGEELSRYFRIKKKDFEYYKGKKGKGYFILENKKEIILSGPRSDDKKNVARFKSEHNNTFHKAGKIYAKKKINFSSSEFLKKWASKNKKKMKEMSISGIKIL